MSDSTKGINTRLKRDENQTAEGIRAEDLGWISGLGKSEHLRPIPGTVSRPGVCWCQYADRKLQVCTGHGVDTPSLEAEPEAA